jgi:hypothetical protein
MRFPALIPAFFILCAQSSFAQAERDFSGTWRLDAARTTLRQMPVAPAGFLKVNQSANAITLTMSEQEDGPATIATFSLTYGKSEKSRVAEYTWNTATKWEGSALLVNTIVTGPQDYAQDERWERSRDGHILTIERTISRRGIEAESKLVYTDGNAPPPETAPAITRRAPAPQTFTRQPERVAAAPAEPTKEFVVASGTRILMRLTNSVNTKRTAVGDKIYLQTAAPIFIDRQLVIPVGSYVTGVVTEAERAGRVKGKSGLNLRFESLTFPNGVTRDFRSRAGSVDARGDLDKNEGRIAGESNKGGDARTVAGTTAAGTGVGAIAGAAAGHVGMGAGIGAAAGAIGGLAGVLGSRGLDVVLPPGTTMELVLDRELRYSIMELPVH